MYQLILASSSPYRKKQLDKLGLVFTTESPNVDEIALNKETARDTALRLSELKAKSVAKYHPNALIVGSDQVASLNNNQIGKPLTHQNAVAQLNQMQGQVVHFYTGICLYNSASQSIQLSVVETKVKFRQLSETEIENYLLKDKPYDCAGSAKSESLGIALLEYIRGDDPNALIGLPIINLVSMLKNEGIHVI